MQAGNKAARPIIVDVTLMDAILSVSAWDFLAIATKWNNLCCINGHAIFK